MKRFKTITRIIENDIWTTYNNLEVEVGDILLHKGGDKESSQKILTNCVGLVMNTEFDVIDVQWLYYQDTDFGDLLKLDRPIFRTYSPEFLRNHMVVAPRAMRVNNKEILHIGDVVIPQAET